MVTTDADPFRQGDGDPAKISPIDYYPNYYS